MDIIIFLLNIVYGIILFYGLKSSKKSLVWATKALKRFTIFCVIFIAGSASIFAFFQEFDLVKSILFGSILIEMPYTTLLPIIWLAYFSYYYYMRYKNRKDIAPNLNNGSADPQELSE